MVQTLDAVVDHDPYLTDMGFEITRPSNQPNYARLRSSRASRTSQRRKRPNAPGGIRQRRNSRWSW